MQPIDAHLFLWLNATSATPAWTVKLALFASQELPGLIVAGTIGALLVGESDMRRRVMRVLLAMAMAWAVARLGQHLFTMARPFTLGLGTQWLIHGNSAGFPSTHASVAFAFAASVVANARNRWVAVTACMVAGLIAWSRICLGLHFPSDVLAGLVVGLVCAPISSALLRLPALPRTAH